MLQCQHNPDNYYVGGAVVCFCFLGRLDVCKVMIDGNVKHSIIVSWVLNLRVPKLLLKWRERLLILVLFF